MFQSEKVDCMSKSRIELDNGPTQCLVSLLPFGVNKLFSNKKDGITFPLKMILSLKMKSSYIMSCLFNYVVQVQCTR